MTGVHTLKLVFKAPRLGKPKFSTKDSRRKCHNAVESKSSGTSRSFFHWISSKIYRHFSLTITQAKPGQEMKTRKGRRLLRERCCRPPDIPKRVSPFNLHQNGFIRPLLQQTSILYNIYVSSINNIFLSRNPLTGLTTTWHKVKVS